MITCFIEEGWRHWQCLFVGRPALERRQRNNNKDPLLPYPSLTSSLIIFPSSVTHPDIHFHLCVNHCIYIYILQGGGSDPLLLREMKPPVTAVTEVAFITVSFINLIVKCHGAPDRSGPRMLRPPMRASLRQGRKGVRKNPKSLRQ